MTTTDDWPTDRPVTAGLPSSSRYWDSVGIGGERATREKYFILPCLAASRYEVFGMPNNAAMNYCALYSAMHLCEAYERVTAAMRDNIRGVHPFTLNEGTFWRRTFLSSP